MNRHLLVAAIIALALAPCNVVAADEPLALLPAEQQILLKDSPVQVDQPLYESLAAAAARRVLTIDELNQKRLIRLQELARLVNSQRDSMVEFEGYVKWMGGTLAGYSKYVEAGSFAANFARLLPIPYAGQAGQLSKFVSHFALSLSATSVSVKQFLTSSQYFSKGAQSLGGNIAGREAEIAALTFFADQQLVKDMLELQARLSATSELSASALSFLISLQQYLGSTDEYWQKTKSLVSKKEADKVERGALAGSIEGLKARAEEFNKRLKVYDENVGKILPQVGALVTYDELRQFVESK